MDAALDAPVRVSNTPDIKRIQDSAKRYEASKEFRLAATYHERAAKLLLVTDTPRAALPDLRAAVADWGIVAMSEKRESRNEEIRASIKELNDKIEELSGKGPTL